MILVILEKMQKKNSLNFCSLVFWYFFYLKSVQKILIKHFLLFEFFALWIFCSLLELKRMQKLSIQKLLLFVFLLLCYIEKDAKIFYSKIFALWFFCSFVILKRLQNSKIYYILHFNIFASRKFPKFKFEMCMATKFCAFLWLFMNYYYDK